MRRSLVVGAVVALGLTPGERLDGQQETGDSGRSVLVVADSLQLLLPTVVNGLRQLTDTVSYEPLFADVLDANRMGSAFQALTPLRELLGALSSGDEAFSREPFPDTVMRTVTRAEELLYVRVTPFGGVHEFQLTHFRVSAPPSTPAPDTGTVAEGRAGAEGTQLLLADLTQPGRSVSVIVDVESADYELRLTRALVQLFPESNTSPTARIHVNGRPLDPDRPIRVFAGDTVRLDGSASQDGDLPPQELSYLWTVTSDSNLNLNLDRRTAAQSIVVPEGEFRLRLRVSDGVEDAYDEAVGQIVGVPRATARLGSRSLRLNATRGLFGAWAPRDTADDDFFDEVVAIEIDPYDPGKDSVCVRVGERGERTCDGVLRDREGRLAGRLDRDREAETDWPYTIRIAGGPSRTDTLHVTVTRYDLPVLRDSVVVEVYREPTMLHRFWIGAAYSTIETADAPEGGDYSVSVGTAFVIRPMQNGYLEIGIPLAPSLTGYERGVAAGIGGWFDAGRLRSRVGAKLVLIPCVRSGGLDGGDSEPETFTYFGMTAGAIWALEPVERSLQLVAEVSVLAGGPGEIEGTLFEANIGLAFAF